MSKQVFDDMNLICLLLGKLLSTSYLVQTLKPSLNCCILYLWCGDMGKEAVGGNAS